MSNELIAHQANERVGFNNPNERILQEAIAFIESVALYLEDRDDLNCYATVLHKATAMLCEIEVK